MSVLRASHNCSTIRKIYCAAQNCITLCILVLFRKYFFRQSLRLLSYCVVCLLYRRTFKLFLRFVLLADEPLSDAPISKPFPLPQSYSGFRAKLFKGQVVRPELCDAFYSIRVRLLPTRFEPGNLTPFDGNG